MIKIDAITEVNLVLFIDPIENTICYEIRKQDLNDIIDKDLSAWIIQLMNKTWIDIDVLYQLAAIIVKEHPGNSINWKSTFFVVEKKNYLDIKAESLLPKEESIGANVINKLKFNRDESTPENHLIINGIVNEKLKAYNLN